MVFKNRAIIAITCLLVGAILNFSLTNVFDSSQKNTVLDDSSDVELQLSNSSAEIAPENDTHPNNNTLKQTVLQQASVIQSLKDEINALSKRLAVTSIDEISTNNENKENNNAPLKKMGMDDFESLTKETFIDKFKGVVLSVSGKQLESLKKGFENSVDSDGESLAYQNQISDYLLNNNPYSEHYVDDIRCQGDICRLEISTSNEDNWNQLYADMTRQDWYTSITFEEESEYPGQHIYYLPNITN